MSYIIYNGKLYEEGAALVGAGNRGLRYGDGLFETMKIKAGRLEFEAEHFDRLWKGMKVLEFDVPQHFTTTILKNQILVLCKKNGHETNARVRVNVVRGEGGLYDAKNHSPNYIVESWLMDEFTGEWNSNGLVLGIYTDAKKSCDILSNLKHNNYLPYVLAALHAKKQKWNDAVLLNSSGRICDTTIANIFLIKNEVIYTPHLTEGCVAGIMRKMLIKELIARNWEIIETEISIDALLSADEVFLTNSMYNIRWVQRIGEKQYAHIVIEKIYTSFIPTIS